MDSKAEKTKKVVGFNIIENECIWMKCGVVGFKECQNAYDCNSCAFDKAMSAATQPGRDKDGKRKPTFREKAKRKGYEQRYCRHMLTGRVDVRKCANDFRCETCSFDQMLDEIDAQFPVGLAAGSEVEGYRYADSYYFHDGHAWARVEYGGRVRVGIDDFAMRLLGRPDQWHLPKIGDRVCQSERGFELGRNGNQADVLSPVRGTVVAVNRRVLDAPPLAHDDPFDSGWLFLVEPERLKKDLEGLYFGQHGKAWLTSEVQVLHGMVLGEHATLAATGAPPVDDLVSEVPEIGWRKLVETFLKS